ARLLWGLACTPLPLAVPAAIPCRAVNRPGGFAALQDYIARDFLAASRVHPACGGKSMLSASPTRSSVNRSDRYPSPTSPG
ncbi:hypothetical protein I5I60_24850, partial [Pseudomonas aeruginosa]|nr:hypothetical protein [Pseudomonas aeruginosa]